MNFEDVFNRVWVADFEVFAHDWLLVCKNYDTKEEKIFHNTPREEIYSFIQKERPIFVGHNFKGYDQYILKAILAGFDIEEVKKVNDDIVNGIPGWQIDYGERVEIPPVWDTIQDIVPFKSLKEIEGNLGLDITETTIPFDLPTKWTKEQYEEVLYYCEHDVDATMILFKERYDYFEAKWIICQMGNIDPIQGLSLTNSNLTARFLNARRIEHNDKNDYKYPSNFELDKIDKRAKKYFDEFINGERDIDDEKLELDIDETKGNVGSGGLHLAINNYTFVSENFNESDYYE